MAGLVVPVESDALLDLLDGFIGVLEGLDAMAALVLVRLLELAFGQPQMLEGSLHVRLVGAETANDATSEENKSENTDDEDAVTAGERAHGFFFP